MRYLVIAIVFLLLPRSNLFAQKVGDTVVVIAEKEAELKDDKGKLLIKVPRSKFLRIQNVKNESFRVGYLNFNGWISSADAVLFDEAMETFSAAIKKNSSNWEDYINRGLLWHEKKDYDKAIADHSKAIELNPQSDRAYHNRGWSYHLKKEYEQALSDYNRAIELDPKWAATFVNRGAIRETRKEFRKAIDDYTEAIRLDPGNVENYVNRGSVWIGIKNYERARADFNEAIRLDRNFDEAYASRGFVWSLQEDYAKALDDFNRAIALNPQSDNAFSYRGDLWQRRREYEKALADYATAISINPENNYAFTGRAWIYATCPIAAFRNGDQAVEDALKGCKINNWQDALDLNSLAAAYAETGNFDEAVKWQLKAIELAPANEKEFYRYPLQNYKSGKPYRDGVVPFQFNKWVVIGLFVAIILGILGGFLIGDTRKFVVGFILGFLLGPIGVVITILIAGKNRDTFDDDEMKPIYDF